MHCALYDDKITLSGRIGIPPQIQQLLHCALQVSNFLLLTLPEYGADEADKYSLSPLLMDNVVIRPVTLLGEAVELLLLSIADPPPSPLAAAAVST